MFPSAVHINYIMNQKIRLFRLRQLLCERPSAFFIFSKWGHNLTSDNFTLPSISLQYLHFLIFSVKRIFTPKTFSLHIFFLFGMKIFVYKALFTSQMPSYNGILICKYMSTVCVTSPIPPDDSSRSCLHQPQLYHTHTHTPHGVLHQNYI